MKAVIPFKKKGAKSSLKPFLNDEEREELAMCMLKDVIVALSGSAIKETTIITTSKSSTEEIKQSRFKNGFDLNLKLDVREDERELNAALNDILRGEKSPLLIIMADLPLVREENINAIIGYADDIDVVISPGRRGGTNALFLRRPFDFVVSYYGISFLAHVEAAKKRNMQFAVYDSFFVYMDIDEVEDLIDLLIHDKGKGFAVSYLRQIGVYLHLHRDKEVSVNRDTFSLYKKDNRC
jgi:2-phospho-L-lactate guanylyltransferase